MPIRRHLAKQCTFEPEEIQAMSTAFDEVCVALRVFSANERGRQIIATRIVDLARDGVIDPAALRDRVIAEAKLSL